MNYPDALAEIEARLAELPYLDLNTCEYNPQQDEAADAVPHIRLKWRVDQVESYEADFDWIDSGLDIVMGSICTDSFPKMLVGNDWGGPIEWAKGRLPSPPTDMAVLDNGAPDFMALVTFADGVLGQTVWLLDTGLADFSTQPRLLDTGLSVSDYLAYAVSCAGFSEWQRALMGPEHFPNSNSRQQIKHYLPQVFPHLESGKLMLAIS